MSSLTFDHEVRVFVLLHHQRARLSRPHPSTDLPCTHKTTARLVCEHHELAGLIFPAHMNHSSKGKFQSTREAKLSVVCCRTDGARNPYCCVSMKRTTWMLACVWWTLKCDDSLGSKLQYMAAPPVWVCLSLLQLYSYLPVKTTFCRSFWGGKPRFTGRMEVVSLRIKSDQFRQSDTWKAFL